MMSKMIDQYTVLCLWFNTLCPGNYMTLVLFNRDMDVDSSQGNSALITNDLYSVVHTRVMRVQGYMVL